MLQPSASIVAKNEAKVEFDELRTVPFKDDDDKDCQMVVSRLAEVRFVDPNTEIVLSTLNVPYGSLSTLNKVIALNRETLLLSGTHSMQSLYLNMQVTLKVP